MECIIDQECLAASSVASDADSRSLGLLQHEHMTRCDRIVAATSRRLTAAPHTALLQAEFPDFRPLLPPQGSPSAARVRPLLRLERKLFGDWLRWLTSGWCASAFMFMYIM